MALDHRTEQGTSNHWYRRGRAAVLALRYGFGAFFLYGAYHKTTRHWMTSPVMREHFAQRLSELDPQSFSAAYLRRFAIPWYKPVSWVLTIGQIVVSIGMLLGVAVRPTAALSLFLLLNISAGAFFNPSMPPFLVAAVLFMATPSGQWFGLDKQLHAKYPDSIWFK
ncbi:MAG: DoxX family membrane protein [Chloroflexales bacterium]